MSSFTSSVWYVPLTATWISCVLTAAMVGPVFAQSASVGQAQAPTANVSEDDYNPLAMRPIPGTQMPSLRGSADTLIRQSTEQSDVFAGQPIEIGAEAPPESVPAAPIPLSDIQQAREIRQGPVPAVDFQLGDEEVRTVRQNQRTDPDQTQALVQEEVNPFEATGFRMGTSVVNLRLEQSLGYSSNLEQSSGGQSGGFSQTNVSASSVTDWSRHELRLDARGTYRKAFDGDIEDRPTGALEAALRLDLVDGLTSTLRANYNYTTESLTSNNLGRGVSERPGIHTYGGSAELARTGHKLEMTLRGAIERTEYDEASLITGGVLDQVDRNANFYTITGRLGYDTGGAATPFVEATMGWRRFDEEVDRNGDQRNSMTYDLRAGYSFDMSEKLNGEISLVYLREEFEEGGLETLEGYGINGDLTWSPERGTIVVLNAATALNSSTTAGDNGSILYTAGFDITRQVTDRLLLNLNGSLAYDVDEQLGETDTTYTIGVGAQYWMNRYMAIAADIDFTSFDDDNGVDSYEDTMATLGIILQR